MSETLHRVQALVLSGDVLISDHGYDELDDDGILAEDALLGIASAELVEDYPDRARGPSVLALQFDKLVREGKYAAEVPVALIEDETAWSPYLSLDDARKLDAVRIALRAGDLAAASRYGRIFELTPVAAK